MSDVHVSIVDPAPVSYQSSAVGTKRVHIVQTKHGKISVSVVNGGGEVKDEGHISMNAIVTYHDIGVNHSVFWDTLFNYLGANSFLQDFTIFHFDCPGHEPGATELEEHEAPNTLDEMAEQVFSVMTEHFGVHRMVLFGGGAGCGVVTRAALLNPTVVQGLVLVAPQFEQRGWAETLSEYSQSWFPGLFGSGADVGAHVSRLFDPETMADESLRSMVIEYIEEMKRLPPGNVARFARAHSHRLALVVRSTVLAGAVSGPAPTDNPLRTKLRGIKTLVFLPKRSVTYDDGIFAFSCFDPQSTSLVEVDGSGFLVTQQHPAEVSGPLRLFFVGLGYRS
eukprot:Rmarinus@m.6323